MPELPPIRWGAHLVPMLMEVGPSMAAGMGSVAIDDARLGWWQRNTGVDLQAWECRWLIRLSKAYVGESHRAAKPHAPPPWVPDGETPVTELQANLRETLKA